MQISVEDMQVLYTKYLNYASLYTNNYINEIVIDNTKESMTSSNSDHSNNRNIRSIKVMKIENILRNSTVGRPIIKLKKPQIDVSTNDTPQNLKSQFARLKSKNSSSK